MSNYRYGLSLAALLSGLAPPLAAWADDDDAAAAVDEVVVTGTRLSGLRASDSPAPIEVVDAAILARTGKPGVVEALAQTIPSFNAQPFGGDASNLKLAARLRGLSANHALVLVNGKRRHGTSNLTVSVTGGFIGAASADLTFIPVSAIDHVEVLTDGAAAQYGTDAIAGIINIILKRQGQGGSVSATGGAYYEGDGKTGALSGNVGFSPVDGAFLNLTAEIRYHGYSDRGEADQRLFTPANRANPALPLLPGYPYVNKIYGDARYRLAVAAFNAGYVRGDTEVYAFGTYGRRYGASRQNFRLPSVAPGVWPQGFTPVITADEDDYSIAAGVRGKAFGDWTWDLSTTYGRDDNAIGNIGSVNTSLLADRGASPTSFHNGDFIATQWTNNLDVSRSFEVGLAGPLNVAFGVEQRSESFEIKAGDEASRYKTGAQAYPGFGLTDAAKHKRDNIGAYLNLAVEPIEGLLIDAAVRAEHFSDFGDTTVAKLTARYDFNEAFALRGTASTGFRAPTLAEEYYSATTVTPTQAGVRLPPNNAAAALLGVEPLDPEKSTNFSIGLVAHPLPRLSATLDLYQIEIEDRIVSTGTIYGLQNNIVRSPAVTAAIRANGNLLDPTVTSTFISTFVNGADTRTRGAELIVSYATDFGAWGAVDWSLGANYNQTKVTKAYPSSPQIATSGQVYLDKTAISYLETAAPKYKISAGAHYRNGPWSVSLRETLYGPASILADGGSNNNYVKNTNGAKVITDLDVDYQVTSQFKVSWGAANLFDVRPDDMHPTTYAASLAVGGNGVAKTLTFSPFGINGGYYYARLTYEF